MLCQTCQRQSHCLTHQLAEQDSHLYKMLEKLQGCQRRRPMRFGFIHPHRQRMTRVMAWSQGIVRSIRRSDGRMGQQKL